MEYTTPEIRVLSLTQDYSFLLSGEKTTENNNLEDMEENNILYEDF
jgi:hypothetical protein